MVSLTNASVIPSLLFVVVLHFQSWKRTPGDLSVIIDVDDQLVRANSPLAMLRGRRCMSLAVCTQHKVGPVLGVRRLVSLNDYLVVRIDGWTSNCKASFGEWCFPREHDFSSHDDLEHGLTTSVDDEEKSVKFEIWKRTQLAAGNCSTAHHAHAPPICRVPSRLVFDSAILFSNSTF